MVIDHRYRVVQLIGEGGFAQVYHAEHITLERPAALKVLDVARGTRDDNFIRRFQREAKIAANFEHPNVVRIFDFGVIAETQQPYIAMEKLQGWDLDVELRTNGPMHPYRARKLFEGCLEALALAHERGIIHKDLKPANLFLQHPNTDQERLVIMDFGIARLTDDGQLTQTGAFAGTPAYLAPEYIQDHAVTPGFDVYQMGLIFIEALSGRAVVRANSSVAYLMKHVQGEHDVPEGVKTSVLGPLLMQAIEVDPEARFKSAQEFLRELRAIEIPSVTTGDYLVDPGDWNSGTQPMPSVDGQSQEVVPMANTEDAFYDVPATGPNPVPVAEAEPQQMPQRPMPESSPDHPIVPQSNPNLKNRLPQSTHAIPRKPKKKGSALAVIMYLFAFLIFSMFALFMLGLVIAVIDAG